MIKDAFDAMQQNDTFCYDLITWRNILLTVKTFKNSDRRAIHCTLHFSYLDIYISLKNRLCVVDLEGKFQTNLWAKLINFLVRKFRSIMLIFLLCFAEFVKSAFYTLCVLLLFQRVDIFELRFDAKIAIEIRQLL